MRAIAFAALLLVDGYGSGVAYEDDASSGDNQAYFSQDSAPDSGSDSGQSSAE